ncbi:DUF397 domain-containing protein [Streptomyces sp. NPDC054855]
MTIANSNPLPWFTSSYSNGAGGECVECAPLLGTMLVRDSTRRQGPVVAIPSDAWQAFIAGFTTHCAK